ncbi:ribose-phosphate pyrophosphokinase [Sphingomonas abietis]|uniref:Ribose-phosphate pyrophosphokinase n=1 Tax=Sphingomonas abietis TaxID=3012344 RepID=A0ABY7NLN3_9SPHN|nr:ribose-phosphate pyrophosphokinase [Sphingomonas abietis]WBO22467.1 ribose-phosphate pyrophosphokinase [Sphingomonas abietis]
MTDALTPDDAPAPDSAGPNAIADVARVRGLLLDAARAGEAISYSALLAALGHRFTRPKMRAVCKTLAVIDEAGMAAGEPELAVLVVRESDGLPGQGWWAGGQAFLRGHDGPWEGPAARALVDGLQREVFAYWATR